MLSYVRTRRESTKASTLVDIDRTAGTDSDNLRWCLAFRYYSPMKSATSVGLWSAYLPTACSTSSSYRTASRNENKHPVPLPLPQEQKAAPAPVPWYIPPHSTDTASER